MCVSVFVSGNLLTGSHKNFRWSSNRILNNWICIYFSKLSSDLLHRFVHCASLDTQDAFAELLSLPRGIQLVRSITPLNEVVNHHPSTVLVTADSPFANLQHPFSLFIPLISLISLCLSVCLSVCLPVCISPAF